MPQKLVSIAIPKKIGPDDEGNEYPLAMTPQAYFQEIIDQDASEIHGIADIWEDDHWVHVDLPINQIGPLFLDYALAVQTVTQERLQPVIEE